MSGHSHWAGIKHKKGAKDAKRGEFFSKLLNAVAIAARHEPNPDFNPRLRTAVQTAKDSNVPKDRIDNAIKKAKEKQDNLEELTLEAYGPGGIAILMEAVTDSRNRTIAEIKNILGDVGAKWAEAGSVRWAFEQMPNEGWKAKFPQAVDNEAKSKTKKIIETLEENDDIQKVYTNAVL